MLAKLERFVASLLITALLIATVMIIPSLTVRKEEPEQIAEKPHIRVFTAEAQRREQRIIRGYDNAIILAARMEKYPPLDTALVDDIISNAQKYLGVPYRRSGKTPAGFDCSGYVNYVLRESGYKINIPCADDLYYACMEIPEEEVKAGDLIFFKGTYKTEKISHVGIVLGDGRMIHAGTKGICYADLSIEYWTKHFFAYGRIQPVI